MLGELVTEAWFCRWGTNNKRNMERLIKETGLAVHPVIAHLFAVV